MNAQAHTFRAHLYIRTAGISLSPYNVLTLCCILLLDTPLAVVWPSLTRQTTLGPLTATLLHRRTHSAGYCTQPTSITGDNTATQVTCSPESHQSKVHIAQAIAPNNKCKSRRAAPFQIMSFTGDYTTTQVACSPQNHTGMHIAQATASNTNA